ncbi:hypothetical protein IWQ62_000182 [Dispira parvispora]|uniref:Uncharacterized protein n=1 Tax=Dispira parvispora TaxID=1520584 RepID=A0A9W8AWG4_9FUNG|nr:hypothetical protein IWQ62_000182 [Dispira parvispora]
MTGNSQRSARRRRKRPPHGSSPATSIRGTLSIDRCQAPLDPTGRDSPSLRSRGNHRRRPPSHTGSFSQGVAATTSTNQPSNLHATSTATASAEPLADMPAIPGFYYCPSRKRYFKLGEGGADKSNPFHREKVQEQEKAVQREREIQENRNVIQRRGLSWPSFFRTRAMTSVVRQSTTRCTSPKGCDDMAAQSVQLRGVGLLNEAMPPHQARTTFGQDALAGVSPIVGFHTDFTTTTLTAATQGGRVLNYTSRAQPELPPTWEDWCYSSMVGFGVTLSHLTAFRDRVVCVHPGHGAQPGRLILTDPHHQGHSAMYQVPHETLWNIACGPDHVAVGTSQGLVDFVRETEGGDLTINQKIITGSDVFALQFHRSDDNTLVAGCRDGRLRIFDLRHPCRPDFPAYGVLAGMGHPGASVAQVRQVDDWFWVSSSTAGSIALWDLRMPYCIGNQGTGDLPTEPSVTLEPGTQVPVVHLDYRDHLYGSNQSDFTHNKPRGLHQRLRDRKTRRTHAGKHIASFEKRMRAQDVHPVLQYQGHVNTHHRDLGFALHPDQPLLAAAGADHCLRIWNIRTGEPCRIVAHLPNLIQEKCTEDGLVSTIPSNEPPPFVRALQWQPVLRQSTPYSLVGAIGCTMFHFDL